MAKTINYSSSAFTGWTRFTAPVPHKQGTQLKASGDFFAVVGRPVGDGRNSVVDLYHTIPAGALQSIPLLDDEDVIPEDQRREIELEPEAIRDPVKFFGVPAINGVELDLISIEQDGAAFACHLRGKLGELLWADLRLDYYPGQPWANWVLTLNHSNIQRGDEVAPIDQDLRLTFGGATVFVLGRGAGAPVMMKGDYLGDAQARGFPGTVVWHDRITSAAQYASALAQAEGLVHGFGLQSGSFGPLLEPAKLPAGCKPLEHLRSTIQEAVDDLHNWSDHSKVGAVADAGRTGGQEDQGWTQMSEAFALEGTGTHWMRYLVALSQLKRPIHYREPNGELLDLDGHPGLVMWSGRPDARFSEDMLGRIPGSEQKTHGWEGPDRQHWFVATLAAAAIATGDRTLQWSLEAHARLFMFSETVDPNLVTSGPGAARAVGWTGLTVSWLWRALDDRDLANRVRDRYIERVKKVYVPSLSRQDYEVAHWDHIDDNRVWHDMSGKKDYAGAWMPYQQAVGAGGLQIAGEVLDIPEARELAYRGALAVVNHGFTQEPISDHWLEWDFVAYRVPGQPLSDEEVVQGQGAHRSTWFANAWFPFAPWVVLRHDPANARARSIYQQMKASAMRGAEPTEWLPPI